MTNLFLPSLAELHARRQISETLANDPVIRGLHEQRRQSLSDAVSKAQSALDRAPADDRGSYERALTAARSALWEFEGMPDPARQDIAYCASGVAFVTGAIPPEFPAQVAEQERLIPRQMSGFEAMQDRQARMSGAPLAMGHVFIGDPTNPANWF